MANQNILPTEELYEAIRIQDLELVRKAISRGADLASTLHGLSYTPLGWATFHGLANIVEALVNAGAPVPTNALQPLGVMDITDYMIDPIELEPDYARVTEILIANGASPNINDYEGKPLIESFPAKYYPNIHGVLSEALARLKGQP
jgi:ankyrin repeat protein